MNDQPGTLHLFCGKAGAGKSTLAAAMAQQHRALLISEDVWLTRLFADQIRTFEDYILYSRRLKTVISPLVTDLLTRGIHVVLDYPANTRVTRRGLVSISEAARAPHVLHHLDASDALCLQRIAARNMRLPEGSRPLSAEDFHQVTAYFESPIEPGLNVERHTQS